MTGGFISLSGRKQTTYKDLLRFIRLEYKLPYNAYMANINRKYIFIVDIYITEENKLLLMLSDDLNILERKIYSILERILSKNKIQINYKIP